MGLLDDNVPHQPSQPSLDLFAVLRRVNVGELSRAELIAYAQAQAICALAATAGGGSLR
jgi:hypothetical protein